MNRKTWLAWASAIVLVFVLGAVAQASAPDWRGQAGTTYQRWLFDSDANPAAPNYVTNPYGPVCAAVTVGDFGVGWIDSIPGFGTRTGYWDLGSVGNISVNLPNRPLQREFKEMWVRVTYFEDITQAPVISVNAVGEVSLIGESTEIVESVGTGGRWIASLTKWRIVPNPACEQVVITSDMFGSIIDEVEIDTLCIPEPSSFAALLAGIPFLGLVRRRKP